MWNKIRTHTKLNEAMEVIINTDSLLYSTTAEWLQPGGKEFGRSTAMIAFNQSCNSSNKYMKMKNAE